MWSERKHSFSAEPVLVSAYGSSKNLKDLKDDPSVQGYLALKNTSTPQGPPWDPGHMHTVGCWGGAFSFK